jgi:hypothetical protein
MASRSTLSTSFFVDLPLSKSARIFRRLWGRRSDPRCSALKGGFLGSSGMVVAGARDSYRQWMDRCRQSNSKGRSGPQLFRKLPLISGYAVNHGVASSLYANLFSSSASLLGGNADVLPRVPRQLLRTWNQAQLHVTMARGGPAAAGSRWGNLPLPYQSTLGVKRASHGPRETCLLTSRQ